MRAHVRAGEGDRSAEVLGHGSGLQGLAAAVPVIERDGPVQKGEVARLLKIGAHRQHDPQVIVAVIVRALLVLGSVADAALHRQRVELVHGRSVAPLDAQ